MTLKEIQEKKAIAKRMHEFNKERVINMKKSMFGMFAGLGIAVLGTILLVTAPGPGAMLISGAVTTFLGSMTTFGSLACRLGYEVADINAREKLSQEFPEIIKESDNLKQKAQVYSNKVVKKLVKMETVALNALTKEDGIDSDGEIKKEVLRVSEQNKIIMLQNMQEDEAER